MNDELQRQIGRMNSAPGAARLPGVSLNANFRRNLLSLRDKRGLSTNALAKAASLSESGLRHYLSGYSDGISIANAEKVADALNVPLLTLLLPPEEAASRIELDTLLRGMSEADLAALLRLLTRQEPAST